MPWCTQAAASRGVVLSAHAVRKAMTSCCVTASTAATASGVGAGADRTGSTASAGTVPAAAWASSTIRSTAHHSSYLCASLQTRPISGSVYRSIQVLLTRSEGRASPPGRHRSLLERRLELRELCAQPRVADREDLHGE